MSYVVTVEFEISAPHLTSFMAHMLANARESLRVESECRQFDVCRSPEALNRIFLYEVYDDRHAFDVHLASPHFKAFDSQVAGWVLSKRVATYLRED
jgi:autoinducer 2-degrading protein